MPITDRYGNPLKQPKQKPTVQTNCIVRNAAHECKKKVRYKQCYLFIWECSSGL